MVISAQLYSIRDYIALCLNYVLYNVWRKACLNDFDIKTISVFDYEVQTPDAC